MPEVTISLGEGMPIGTLIKEAGLCPSTSEAMRMVKQGAVKIDGEKVQDPKSRIDRANDFVLQVGKRKFAKILLN